MDRERLVVRSGCGHSWSAVSFDGCVPPDSSVGVGTGEGLRRRRRGLTLTEVRVYIGGRLCESMSGRSRLITLEDDGSGWLRVVGKYRAVDESG